MLRLLTLDELFYFKTTTGHSSGSHTPQSSRRSARAGTAAGRGSRSAPQAAPRPSCRGSRAAARARPRRPATTPPATAGRTSAAPAPTSATDKHHWTWHIINQPTICLLCLFLIHFIYYININSKFFWHAPHQNDCWYAERVLNESNHTPCFQTKAKIVSQHWEKFRQREKESLENKKFTGALNSIIDSPTKSLNTPISIC